MRATILVLSTLVALLPAFDAPATIIHVTSDQPTIKDGMDAASVGDTVMVECGTYYEYDIELTWGTTLTSETGSYECVTIDAENQGRPLYLIHGANYTTTVRGITIRNGYASSSRDRLHGGGALFVSDATIEVIDCRFVSNSADESGGAIRMYAESAIIEHCLFEGNTAEFGGGIEGCSDTMRVDGCSFSGNIAERGGGSCITCSGSYFVDCTFTDNVASVVGGGVGNYAGGLTLEGCVFDGNSAVEQGGAVYGLGAGALPEVTLAIEDCDFAGNHVDAGEGGAVCGDNEHRLFISNSSFSGNSASYRGGAISANHKGDMINCVVVGNSATSYAGGTYIRDRGTVTSCTFVSNESPQGSALALGQPDSLVIRESILAFGESGTRSSSSVVYCLMSGDSEIFQCYVFGNAGGDSLCGTFHDNMFVDPLLCDYELGDVSLCADSPCLPTGDNPWGILIGALGAGCGPCGSPVRESSWGAIKALYR